MAGIEESAAAMVKTEAFNQAVYGMNLVEKLIVPAEGPSDYADHPPRVFKQWMQIDEGFVYQGEIDANTGKPDARGVMIV